MACILYAMQTLYTQSLRPSCNQSKSKLLTLAKSGAPLPNVNSKSIKTRRLKLSFDSYIRVGGFAHDPIFKKSVQEINPDWFMSGYQLREVERKKKILLLASKSYYTSPASILDTNERAMMSQYTNPKHAKFDLEFMDELGISCPSWVRHSERWRYMLIDLESFFLEHRHFPTALKGSYLGSSDIQVRREGYLYYWFREFSRNARGTDTCRFPKRKIQSGFRKFLRSSKLPSDLLTLNLQFFNRYLCRLKELEDFYITHGRLPKIMKGRHKFDGSNINNDHETSLCLWMRTRLREDSRGKLWVKIARPLIENSALPNNVFEQGFRQSQKNI